MSVWPAMSVNRQFHGAAPAPVLHQEVCSQLIPAKSACRHAAWVWEWTLSLHSLLCVTSGSLGDLSCLAYNPNQQHFTLIFIFLLTLAWRVIKGRAAPGCMQSKREDQRSTVRVPGLNWWCPKKGTSGKVGLELQIINHPVPPGFLSFSSCVS